MTRAWNETMIARKLARAVFQRKCVVMVQNCSWTGEECDLLVVTKDLRVIDVEVKISRADLKADASKSKWWHRLEYTGRLPAGPRRRRQWPDKVWKHYYAMPAEIWKPELLAAVNEASGILLMTGTPGYSPRASYRVERMAKPNRDAERLTPAAALDVARLANLRMWDALAKIDNWKPEAIAA